MYIHMRVATHVSLRLCALLPEYYECYYMHSICVWSPMFHYAFVHYCHMHIVHMFHHA